MFAECLRHNSYHVYFLPSLIVALLLLEYVYYRYSNNIESYTNLFFFFFFFVSREQQILLKCNEQFLAFTAQSQTIHGEYWLSPPVALPKLDVQSLEGSQCNSMLHPRIGASPESA